jgi:hypothetical protein
LSGRFVVLGEERVEYGLSLTPELAHAAAAMGPTAAHVDEGELALRAGRLQDPHPTRVDVRIGAYGPRDVGPEA